MLSKILIKVLDVHSGPESLEFAGFKNKNNDFIV